MYGVPVDQLVHRVALPRELGGDMCVNPVLTETRSAVGAR